MAEIAEIVDNGRNRSTSDGGTARRAGTEGAGMRRGPLTRCPRRSAGSPRRCTGRPCPAGATPRLRRHRRRRRHRRARRAARARTWLRPPACAASAWDAVRGCGAVARGARCGVGSCRGRQPRAHTYLRTTSESVDERRISVQSSEDFPTSKADFLARRSAHVTGSEGVCGWRGASSTGPRREEFLLSGSARILAVRQGAFMSDDLRAVEVVRET